MPSSSSYSSFSSSFSIEITNLSNSIAVKLEFPIFLCQLQWKSEFNSIISNSNYIPMKIYYKNDYYYNKTLKLQ